MDAENTVKHKFLEGSNMTFQEVFDFAFKKLVPVRRLDTYSSAIPTMLIVRGSTPK